MILHINAICISIQTCSSSGEGHSIISFLKKKKIKGFRYNCSFKLIFTNGDKKIFA